MAGFPSFLNLHYTPPVDESGLTRQWLDIYPQSNINYGSPIEFIFEKTPKKYVDLSQSTLHVKLQILKHDKTNITAENDVTLVNSPLSSLWNGVETYINHQLIVNSMPYHHTKCMLDLYTNNVESIDTQLFRSDQSPVASVISKNATNDDDEEIEMPKNESLVWRNAYTSLSKFVDLCGPIQSDLTSVEKIFPDNLHWKFVFYPARNDFVLLSNDEQEYAYNIAEMKISLCLINVSDSMYHYQTNALTKEPAYYHYFKSHVTTYNIMKGSLNFTIDNLFNGKIPERMILAMTDSDGLAGHPKYNPYMYDNFDIRQITYDIDGVNNPATRINTNFKDNLIMQGFQTIHNNDIDSFINREMYNDGYSIFVINLKNNCENYVSPMIKGHSRLSLDFGEHLPKNISLIIYAVFQNVFSFDKNKEITMH